MAASITFRGPFNSGITYSKDDMVTLNGSSYIATEANLNVLPAGSPSSAADWALVAAAGVVGATGATGPGGVPGIPGPVGATGAAGLTGAAGIQGVPGAPGLAGFAGAMGAAGPAGLTGQTGKSGQTGLSGQAGPTGPIGPAGPASAPANVLLPLAGLHWMPVGDSITAKGSASYQNAVLAATGLTIPLQDARGGRTTAGIFENYGNDPISGISRGGFLPTSNDGSCFQASATDGTVVSASTGIPCNTPGPWSSGKTLAQDLQNVDIVTIYLGTNDAGLAGNLGSLQSIAGDGSYYGHLMAAVEGYLRAKPGIRLFWIAPYQNNDCGTSCTTILTAIRQVCGQYAVPVLDLYRTSGVTPLTYSYYLQGDKVHPTAAGAAMLGRRFASTLVQAY